jgi:hypothetical protein
MSSNICPKLRKLLSENVLSGEFKITNFKAKLKFFLEYSTDQLSELRVFSKTHVLESIKAVIKDASATDYQASDLPVPKTGRLWVSIVYAILVLNEHLSTELEAKDFLLKRYCDKGLVFDPDTLSICAEHGIVALKLGATIGRKRSLPEGDSETQSKRQRVRIGLY